MRPGPRVEIGQRLQISRHFVRQKLQRDETVQSRVLGLVDHAHAAAAQLFENPVMRNRLADHCANLTAVRRLTNECREVGRA